MTDLTKLRAELRAEVDCAKEWQAFLMVRPENIRALLDALDAAERERDEARAALKSIAASTCCDGCQEAALVAKAALEDRTP
jgi:hypothetical protein